VRRNNEHTRGLALAWAWRVDRGTLESYVSQLDFVAEAAMLSADNEFSILKGGRHLSRETVTPLVVRAVELGVPVQEGDCAVVPVVLGGEYRHSYWLRFDLQPPQSAYEPLRTAYAILILGTLVSMMVTTWVLDRWILRPLIALEAGAERAARGEFSQPVPIPAGGNDEMSALARSFNAMMAEVGASREDLHARVGESVRKMRAAEKNLVTAQRLAAVGTLAAGIAHDINNPLGGMINAVRTLRRPDLSPEKRTEYLGLVEDGLDRVAHTVQKVLQFSPHQVAPQVCDLAAVAGRASDLARHRLEMSGAVLVSDLPEGSLRVFGDPYELQQVFLNLLVNAADAVRAAGRSPGRVEMRGSVEKGEVRVSVSDDGVGMDEEQASKVFDLFFTTKGVGEGSGLGLSIVHSILESHGGRIELRSAPGEGATFTIVLPLHR
jgi:signal transduction histidine kinase